MPNQFILNLNFRLVLFSKKDSASIVRIFLCQHFYARPVDKNQINVFAFYILQVLRVSALIET